MICTKFEWNWPVDSEEDFFHYNHIPVVAPPVPRGPWFEQTWIYVISKSFLVIWALLTQRILRRFLIDPVPFLWLSPLWRGAGPLSEQFRTSFTQGCFVLSFIEIFLLVLEKEIFKNFQYILTLLLLSPLAQVRCSSFTQFKTSLSPRNISAKSG
jgi:hypothetical protein